MKLAAKSWPEIESVFEFAKLATFTAESEAEAKVLGQLATILRSGVPTGFEGILADFIQKDSPT